MLSQINKLHKKVNPKRKKRQHFVDVGRPKVAIRGLGKTQEHEKLSDWEHAS